MKKLTEWSYIEHIYCFNGHKIRIVPNTKGESHLVKLVEVMEKNLFSIHKILELINN